jgi:hypothetical protein
MTYRTELLDISVHERYEYTDEGDTQASASRGRAFETDVDVYAAQITRRKSISQGSRPGHTRQSSSTSRPRGLSIRSQSQISPPLTPKTSREVMSNASTIEPEAIFPNYLRAFYHFHPSSTVSSITDESSITVPINQGDVILVHSVHPNGWADGTLLVSGARGWLPTNYCEAYDPPAVRSLLNALTHLWDLVRTGEHDSLIAFTRQDYVREMIAGVRFFLVGLLRFFRSEIWHCRYRAQETRWLIICPGKNQLFVQRVAVGRDARRVTTATETPTRGPVLDGKNS